MKIGKEIKRYTVIPTQHPVPTMPEPQCPKVKPRPREVKTAPRRAQVNA